MDKKIINQMQDPASYAEESLHEYILSHRLDGNQKIYIRAQMFNFSFYEASETIITEDGHSSSPPANPHASTEYTTLQHTIYVIRTQPRSRLLLPLIP